MYVFKVRDDRFFIRLELGEEAMDELKAFACTERIGTASLRGIGAARAAEFAIYNLPEQHYEPNAVDETTEVTSFIGNIGRDDAGEPLVHVHVTLGRRDGSVVGGHLLRLEVGATLEIDLETFPGTLRRSLVPTIGLPLQCEFKQDVTP